MKVIILAAGKGTRLGALTENTPKPLMEVKEGQTLLEFQIKRIETCKAIDEVFVIIGYLAAQVDAKLSSLKTTVKCSTIHNPFYDVSNNLMSLWFAKDVMKTEDFIITNGDNVYDADVWNKITSVKEDGIYLSIDHKDEYDEDDMKVKLDDSGLVQWVSKKIPKEESHAESIGLVLVKGKPYRHLFREMLTEMSHDPKYLNVFWLTLFEHLHDRGIEVKPFLLAEDEWQELDFHMDLDDARKFVQAKIREIE